LASSSSSGVGATVAAQASQPKHSSFGNHACTGGNKSNGCSAAHVLLVTPPAADGWHLLQGYVMLCALFELVHSAHVKFTSHLVCC
jgi:hypothetical protein